MSVGFVKDEERKFTLPRWLGFLKNYNSDFYYYLFMVVMGILFFALSLFQEYFTTPFTGDYVSQQFAFYTNGYDDWWKFFTTGHFPLYDTNTFLGASNIGSNSFYYLFDPFFMPILLFPRAIIPQGMAILTIFKMALAGLIFHYYLKYLGISRKTARLTGLAYAFCGWIAWFLWFNHFTGVAVVFPLVLLGVEKILREKKPWLLMGSLFGLGLCNFFFFFTFTVCAFLYAMFRWFQRLPKHSASENFKILGIGFVGFLGGCLLAMVVVIPATVVAINAPRAQNTTYLTDLKEALKAHDWGTLIYKIFNWQSVNDGHKVYYPISSFVFPPMTDRGTPLTKLGNESYDNVAGSLFCYTPFIMFLVPALITSAQKKRFSHLIATALFVVMLFTPFCYYAFHGFTYAYCRWTLFASTSLMTYVAFYIDNIKNESRWKIIVGGVTGVALIWLSFYASFVMVEMHSDMKFRYTYFSESIGSAGFTIIECVIATVYVTIATCIYLFRYNKKNFNLVLTTFIGIEIIATGALVLEGHGYNSYMSANNGYDNNVVFQSLIEKIKKDDPTYYRCYSSQENSSARNDSMRHNYNGLGMFHSVYNFNDYGFLNWSQLNDYSAPGSYSASYIEKRQDLDTFLGVKYYFIKKDTAFWGNDAAKANKYKYYRANVPLGFEDITSKYPNDKYYVYENKNYIDFGLTFDKVATYDFTDDKKTEPSSLLDSTVRSEEVYLTHAIINPDNMKYVENVIPQENFVTAKSLSSESKITKVNTKCDVVYYDIHGDSEDNRQDCSSYDFVNNLLDLSKYPSSSKRPDTSTYPGRYVTVMTPKASFPYDEKGMVLYLRASYRFDHRINVYLVTEDEEGNQKFVTFDNHNDAGFDINTEYRKNYRGFYLSSSIDENGNFVPAPKLTKVIICARQKTVFNYELYYKAGTEVFNNLEELKANPLTDVNFRENHFDFKTNFTTPRVVVTRLPHENGWTIKAKLKDGTEKKLDVFTAQGGYTSFVAPEGEVTYSMDYYTPYLKEGSLLSAVGEFIFASTLLGYLLIKYGKDHKDNYDNNFGIRRNKLTWGKYYKKFASEVKSDVIAGFSKVKSVFVRH